VILARPFGIEVALDWSLIIIFTLVTLNLGAGLLPAWHPDWARPLVWAVAALAAVLFIASVLVHELSHALVARAQGLTVRRITLFVFGGLAELEHEPRTPAHELWMSIVGPITSIALGLGALLCGAVLAGDGAAAAADPEAFTRSLGPLTTLLFWLGPLNVVIGVFNLLPGFPLDGGRVLRAILWWRQKDLARATRQASAIGRGIGWAMIGTGLYMALGGRVPPLGGGAVQGLWLAMLGWFLHSAARSSELELRFTRALEHVPVTAVMRTRFETVPPDTAVSAFVEERVMGTDQRSFPVARDGHLLGIVALDDVRRLAPARWASTRVEGIMTPVEQLVTVEARAGAREAMERLVLEDVEQVPVLDHGRLCGLVRRQDILRWVSLHEPARE
jgi:Zn-dependent protease